LFVTFILPITGNWKLTNLVFNCLTHFTGLTKIRKIFFTSWMIGNGARSEGRTEEKTWPFLHAIFFYTLCTRRIKWEPIYETWKDFTIAVLKFAKSHTASDRFVLELLHTTKESSKI